MSWVVFAHCASSFSLPLPPSLVSILHTSFRRPAPSAALFNNSESNPSMIETSTLPSKEKTTYQTAARIRTQHGHDAAVPHYKQLLFNQYNNVDAVGDTSAASRVAACVDSMKMLRNVGRPYDQRSWENESSRNINQQGSTHHHRQWNSDIQQLHHVLNMSHYHHSAIRQHVFNLPTGTANTSSDDDDSLEQYKNNYPFGPSYVRTLVAGQGVDVLRLIAASSPSTSDATNSNNTWLPSLQILTTLFLLSSCIPKSIFTETLIDGENTLTLLLRLGLVFIFDDETELNLALDEGEKKEWVVPLVHLFPLEIPPLADCGSRTKWRRVLLLTDLHPNVLGLTSIPSTNANGTAGGEEGTVMYIGPDSLALVQHLHASLPKYLSSQSVSRSSSFKILDVCTGSGVQALALLAMLELLRNSNEDRVIMEAVAVDVNERALRFTEFNALLNGFDFDVADSGITCNRTRVCTVRADLLSGEALPRTSKHRSNSHEADKATRLLEELQKKTPKFDFLLANPPFIPVPPIVSDDAALSLRDSTDAANTPRYGLFSCGGSSGEDCLQAIVQMTPDLLANDGLLAIVSEFMNPPLLQSDGTVAMDDVLCTKLEQWWKSFSDNNSTAANGILFTNVNALTSEVYAERRAVPNDDKDLKVWNNHLRREGINSVSPGLLFVKRNGDSERGSRLRVEPRLVPSSIWAPHNVVAVQFTVGELTKLFH